MRYGAPLYGALLLTAILAGLGGCSPGESRVVQGNRDGILYLGNGTEPQTIDPHVLSGSPEANVADALFEPLIIRNPYDESMEPGVARSWDFSDDAMSIVFHLNPEARWSNGEPITAEDFHWTWERALNPALGNQLANVFFIIRNAEAYHLGEIDDFDQVGIEVVDPHTLRVELAYPYPFALINFSYVYMAPLHRATIEAHGGTRLRYSRWTRPENIVGNGPFRLAEWKLQRFLRVERNPYYWDADTVSLNGIVFRPIEGAATEEKMFRSGQLHATNMVPNSKTPGYREQADSPLIQTPQMASYFYVFNTKIPPLDDRRVRRALALAVDRQLLATNVLNDTAIAWGGYVPFGMPDYDPPKLLTFDPGEARRLLAEAGFPDGEGFPELSLLYNTSEDHRTIAVAVQQMWKKHLNLDITLENQEWQVYLTAIREGNFEIARRGWNGDVTPDSFLDYMVSDSPINATGFGDPDFDDIVINQARKTPDVAALMKLYTRAEDILLREAPLLPVTTYTEKRLVQPSVKGLHGRVVTGYVYKYVELDPEAPAWKWQSSET
ncbi:peptide ABC transporter substrate-binding protein [Congregibacter litoralis]|uniref:ABC-type oligopeptide transport system, periplasmic component n=1 Tax=Congregibacter litoralis KT71 TaxID=314285 RepID=A4ABG8_9GAMM|nr:peptide ABC transporter substrate-binding protein [Congregibacter litoralis]EAQ96722.2 ABC-type oligopeptide transport system, periplasmic component [Congregibacter litoralis KT71]